MVFSDLGTEAADTKRGFSAYLWVRDELVRMGVPRAQIAFMQDFRKSAAKQALFAATGAAGVDLESAAVARVAARHRLPFAVLRAVCDPAQLSLPPLALVALDGEGRIGAARVLASLAARPWQIVALLRLARAAAAARAALIGRVGDILRRDRTMP